MHKSACDEKIFEVDCFIYSYLGREDRLFSIANIFRVGKSTTYQIIHEVCPLIWKILSPIYLSWKSAEELNIVAQGYRGRWNFPNFLGAVDGKEIRNKSPPHSGSIVLLHPELMQ